MGCASKYFHAFTSQYTYMQSSLCDELRIYSAYTKIYMKQITLRLSSDRGNILYNDNRKNSMLLMLIGRQWIYDSHIRIFTQLYAAECVSMYLPSTFYVVKLYRFILVWHLHTLIGATRPSCVYQAFMDVPGLFTNYFSRSKLIYIYNFQSYTHTWRSTDPGTCCFRFLPCDCRSSSHPSHTQPSLYL